MAKTIEYYMGLPYKMDVVADMDEGGYAVSFPDLPGCLTCGNTIEEAVRNAEDAKKVWLNAALEEGITIREPAEQAEYSGQFKLRLPKSLHRALAGVQSRRGSV